MLQRGFSGSSFIAAVVLLPSTAPLSSFSDVGDFFASSMGARTLSIPEISNQCERNMAVVFYDADDEAVTTISIDRCRWRMLKEIQQSVERCGVVGCYVGVGVEGGGGLSERKRL